MNRFAGRWLFAVAVVHTAFALFVFRAELSAIIAAGFLDAVGEDPRRAAVAWFTLFGGALAVAALAVDELERQRAPLRRAGIALLALVAYFGHRDHPFQRIAISHFGDLDRSEATSLSGLSLWVSVDFECES